MQRLGLVLFLGVSVVWPLTSGDSKTPSSTPVLPTTVAQNTRPDQSPSTAPAMQPNTDPTPIVSKAWGGLKGKVTLTGDLPVVKVIDKLLTNEFKACHEGTKNFETKDQDWIINKDTKGVANVLVVLKLPENHYFQVYPDDTKRTDVVVLDQPHCAFVPHVSVLFSSYFDGEDQKVSDQKFVIKNSASVSHNSKIVGNPVYNPPKFFLMPPGGSETVSLQCQSKPLAVSCDIHPWMNAKIWTFDHPYAAVTDENGNFTIPRIPAKTKVRLAVWHEVLGFLPAYGGEAGVEKTFTTGTNVENLTIKK